MNHNIPQPPRFSDGPTSPRQNRIFEVHKEEAEKEIICQAERDHLEQENRDLKQENETLKHENEDLKRINKELMEKVNRMANQIKRITEIYDNVMGDCQNM